MCLCQARMCRVARMNLPLLELKGVSCSIEHAQTIFKDINLFVDEGDILVLQGRSGSGKTTLLKCIAHLVLHGGQIRYRGSTPQLYGIAAFRIRVLYVPQRPSLLPGSPRDFLRTLRSLKSHKPYVGDTSKDDVFERAFEVGEAWGIGGDLWDRDWPNLSGGEAQRMLLAAAISLNTAEVLLLDEPTSALDPETSLVVEEHLLQAVNSKKYALKSLIWITHSTEQGRRVGTRFVQLSGGTCSEDSSSPV